MQAKPLSALAFSQFDESCQNAKTCKYSRLQNLPKIRPKSIQADLSSCEHAHRSHPRKVGRLSRKEEGRSGPVSRVLSRTVIPLGLASPQGSSNLPERNAGRANAFLFGLAPDGVCRAVPVTRSAVRSYRTVSPLPRVSKHRSAVCSLLHFPSAHAAQALPGIPPCGARTFLDMGKPCRDDPAHFACAV